VAIPGGLFGRGQCVGAVLDPARQRYRAGQAEPSRQLGRAQPARQLQQRQWIAMRLGHDQVPDPRVQRPGQRRLQQRPRVLLLQPRHVQFREPGQIGARVTRCEHQADRVGGQPPGSEPERLRRSPVQPLLVVDQADQRALRGHLGQQVQHGQPDQEPVRRRPGSQAERGA
jgi:hypothetical protein